MAPIVAKKKIKLLPVLILGTLALMPGSASAAITVNTTSDSGALGGCMGAPGDCSIRQAIEAASPGETVIVPSGSYTVSAGPLSIAQSLNVQGAGARTTSVTGTGGPKNVFSVNSPAGATISGLTVSAGHVTGTEIAFLHGGAILNQSGSVLTLAADAIVNTTLEKTDKNIGAVRGAGIANNGNLTIAGSTISGNVEQSKGPPSANQGAGLFNSGGTVSIVNSTIAGNGQVASEEASSSGSAIENLGTSISLQNVTIAGNTGSPAVRNTATISASNTIVSNGAGGDCEGTITSLGHNLESADQCGLHSAGDLPGRNPLLGLLADNGGPTETEALPAGSPAIDAGDPAACPATDQRGIARPQGPACDIGAFELTPVVLRIVPSNSFSFGRLELNRRKGTATLVVNLPGPGTVGLAGKGIVGLPAQARASTAAATAGPLKLTIKAKGKTRRKLNRTGKARVTAIVTYTPTGGTLATQSKRIRLIKRG
jgi:hypothetical protein